MTMNGALPPSSSETGVRFVAAAAMIRFPVGTLPVMVMRSTSGDGDQRLADRLADAGDDVDDAGRNAGLVEESAPFPAPRAA